MHCFLFVWIKCRCFLHLFYIDNFVLHCYNISVFQFFGESMKKIASLLMCLSLVFIFAVGTSALTGENYALFSSSSDVDIPINEHIGGDANGDGKVTLVDAIALLRVSVGDFYNTSRDGIDANEDGVVSVLDVVEVVRYIVGDSVDLGNLVTAK